MSISRSQWRVLKHIFLQSPEIYDLVTSWVDDAEPSAFITRWNKRYFLARLVDRAFKELRYSRVMNPVEDVELEGEMATYFSRDKITAKRHVPTQYSLFPFDLIEAHCEVRRCKHLRDNSYGKRGNTRKSKGTQTDLSAFNTTKEPL